TRATPRSSCARRGRPGARPPRGSGRWRQESRAWTWVSAFYLADIATQVFVIDDAGEPVAHFLAVEHDVLLGEVGEVEQHFFKKGGHDGVEAARADVLHALVRLGGDARDLLDAVGGELERRT